MNDPRRSTIFPLHPVVSPLAWLNLFYLENGVCFYRTDQKTGWLCCIVHVFLVNTWFYWDHRSRHKVGIALLKRKRYELEQCISHEGAELQGRYKAIQWKLDTKKWGIMLKIVIGQGGTLTLGEGGDNLFLLSQLTLCNKVWAKVNTQIRSYEKFQFKHDTGVRMKGLE